jgi:hypothetical protein
MRTTIHSTGAQSAPYTYSLSLRERVRERGYYLARK